jgi:hypothetical protein
MRRYDDTSEWWEVNMSERHENDVPIERRFMFTTHVMLDYVRSRLDLRKEISDAEKVDAPAPPDR